MKSTILLTTALFLISAPSPDSKTLAEMSAGFLSLQQGTGLLAAEKTVTTVVETHESEQLPENPTQR